MKDTLKKLDEGINDAKEVIDILNEEKTMNDAHVNYLSK